MEELFNNWWKDHGFEMVFGLIGCTIAFAVSLVWWWLSEKRNKK